MQHGSLFFGYPATKKLKEEIATDGGSIEIQYPGGTFSARDLMCSGDWDVTYKDCPEPSNVTVKPAVKECRADYNDKKASFYEVQYVEFICEGLNPKFRRLPISFKKLGPCTRKDYDDAKDKAATYGEAWEAGDQVQFAEGGGGDKGKVEQTASSTVQLVPTDYGGWLPRTVATWDNSIDVVWDKDGKQYTASYYPNGTSSWTYKGSNPKYPDEHPPAMPTQFGGQELKFKTVTTTPPEQPGTATDEKKTTSTESKSKATSTESKAKTTEKSTSTGGSNKKGKAAEKESSKTTKSAKTGDDKAAKIKEGVSLELGIAGTIQKSQKSGGMKHKKGMGMY